MKKIFIRADGGLGIGMGHVMRMLVLAKELKHTAEVNFICKADETGRYSAGVEKIKGDGFEVKLINEGNIIEGIINIQKCEKADLLITDSYDVNEEYFNQLKKYFPKTAYMDDVNICKINTDIIINQNINGFEHKYQTGSNTKPHLFIGSEYVLLREEFRNFKRNELNEKVENIMLTIGGSDDNYLSIKIIDILKDINVNMHVVIGAAFKKELVEKICSYNDGAIKIHPHINAKMSEVMKISDMAISACGSTLYELSAMKVPTIGIVIAQNQEEVARCMSDKKMIINAKDLINKNKEEFKECVLNLLNDFELRKSLIDNSSNCVNVNGAEKLTKEIMSLI